MQVQRLNHDSSWYINWQDQRMLIDPWLVGSEIDGFRWLNEQWHVMDPVPISELPSYDYILISQSYEDHCHLETLRVLRTEVPILATGKAFQRLNKHFPDREIIRIPELADGVELEIDGLVFQAFRPAKRLDPIYFALLIKGRSGKGFFYAPHGFLCTPVQEASLAKEQVELLMTTFTDFRLPGWLGGHVNPGMDNVEYLCGLLRPSVVMNTHDEQKIAKGLVSRFAKIEYADLDQVASLEWLNFLPAADYARLDIPLS